MIEIEKFQLYIKNFGPLKSLIKNFPEKEDSNFLKVLIQFLKHVIKITSWHCQDYKIDTANIIFSRLQLYQGFSRLYTF